MSNFDASLRNQIHERFCEEEENALLQATLEGRSHKTRIPISKLKLEKVAATARNTVHDEKRCKGVYSPFQ